MISIAYPESSTNRDLFKTRYYDVIKLNINLTGINSELNHIIFKGSTLDFEKLAKAEFDELILITQLINTHFSVISIARKTKFYTQFDYDKLQPIIANFFIKHSNIPLSSCFYCEIDYINFFKNIGDYSDPIDFINRANKEELMSVKNIGEVKAKKIIDYRNINPILQLSELEFASSITNELYKFDKQSGSNHFTLDHFLPQKDYPYLSLSLFNFVPSCYSCNSKFKKAKNFSSLNNTKYISPTSLYYSLNEDLKFKIFYKNNLLNIKTSKDYTLRTDVLNNKDIVLEYMNLFKIGGRYAFHKESITALIKKKNNYSDSKIKEISRLITSCNLLTV